MSEIELLACPFCGASGVQLGLKSMLGDRCFRVQCVCGAEGGPFSPIRDDLPWGTTEAAITAWNTRASLGSQPGCEWNESHDGWDTGCGNLHVFFEGSPTDNRHDFCPYCGKTILPPQPAGEGAK